MSEQKKETQLEREVEEAKHTKQEYSSDAAMRLFGGELENEMPPKKVEIVRDESGNIVGEKLMEPEKVETTEEVVEKSTEEKVEKKSEEYTPNADFLKSLELFAMQPSKTDERVGEVETSKDKATDKVEPKIESKEPFKVTPEMVEEAGTVEGLQKILTGFKESLFSEIAPIIESIKESTLKSLESTVDSRITTKSAIARLNEDYFKENPQLIPFQTTQQRMAEGLIQKDPAKYSNGREGLKLLLHDSGEATKILLKQYLESLKSKKGNEEKVTKKPAFAEGSTLGKTSEQILSDFERHSSAMFNRPAFVE